MRPNWENECVSKSALIEWLRPYLHTGEPIPADVLISDIQMMPPTLTPPNEWVSVEERLPPPNVRVLAYRPGEGDNSPYKYTNMWGWAVKESIRHKWITHWMYYPAPPGKDNNVPTKAPNELLTQDDLREMEGQPVWVEEVKHWALIDIEKGGQWDGIPFAVWAENGAKFTYNIKERKLHCYRRPLTDEAVDMVMKRLEALHETV